MEEVGEGGIIHRKLSMVGLKKNLRGSHEDLDYGAGKGWKKLMMSALDASYQTPALKPKFNSSLPFQPQQSVISLRGRGIKCSGLMLKDSAFLPKTVK